MLRVLHSAAMLTPSRGQFQQMTWEQNAADRLGLAWHSRFFCPRDAAPSSAIVQYSDAVSAADRSPPMRKLRSWFRFRSDYYDWLERIQDEYDVLLLRYNFHDPYQLSFARRSKRPVYFVHHTLEIPEMFSSHTVPGAVRGIADTVVGPSTLRAGAGVIGVTEEIACYEVRRSRKAGLPWAIYPNGVEFVDDVVKDDRVGPPTLLYVAGTFAVWHGLDLLLDGLKQSTVDLVLHIVGSVTGRERSLVDGDDRVQFHGSMPRNEIARLASSCDLGLSSFALFRNHMKQACTLKVRDYLTMGLPVYAGYDDVFPKAFPYFVNGPVDIDSIVMFAKSMRGISRETVSRAARPYIDKGVLMTRLMRWLETQVTASSGLSS